MPQTTRDGADKRPDPADIHVGGRIRLRRKMLEISQERLAEELGLTFQQVQKYERGANRVSASKLYAIAKSLNVPVSFFFDGLSDADDRPDAEASTSLSALLESPDSLALATAYAKIRSTTHRRNILNLVRGIAEDV